MQTKKKKGFEKNHVTDNAYNRCVIKEKTHFLCALSVTSNNYRQKFLFSDNTNNMCLMFNNNTFIVYIMIIVRLEKIREQFDNF